MARPMDEFLNKLLGLAGEVVQDALDGATEAVADNVQRKVREIDSKISRVRSKARRRRENKDVVVEMPLRQRRARD